MKKTLISTVALLALSAPALASAAPDLSLSVVEANNYDVYETKPFRFKVTNNGTSKAKNVRLAIQLPETATSPTVHIMGAVSSYPAKCTLSGTALDCDLRGVKPGKTKTVRIDMELPYSTAPLTFDLTATSSNAPTETMAFTASPNTVNTAIGAPRLAINTNCSGQGLTSFWECVVSPGSTQSFSNTLEADGTISGLPAGYSGTWVQNSADELYIEYFTGPTLTGTIDARGVGGDCFEGVMIFNNSTPWVAPYEICLQ